MWMASVRKKGMFVRKGRDDKVIGSCGTKREISNYHLWNTELSGNGLGKTAVCHKTNISIDSVAFSIFGGH